jgi:hypothetical protein
VNQVSKKLRKDEAGYDHWCPGCQEMHHLPESWNFDGNLESPTFRPSFKHEGIKRAYVNGKWTGEWLRDAQGNTIPYICHYIITAGWINFQKDCTHALASQSVLLPLLPLEMRDER